MARRQQQDTDGVVTALVYTRVSSDEQSRDGLSLPTQLQGCRQYWADQGWVLGGEYEDILTGSRDDRPGYQAMLTEARRLAGEGRRAAVVVMRLDRLGRKVLERVRVREELKRLGIATHSVREGGEVSDLVANILASVAQEEVARLGDRVRDVRQQGQRNGWHMPGRPAWGYQWRPATAAERAAGAPKSVLIPDPATAPFAAEMFQRHADGESMQALARWITSLPAEARGWVKDGQLRLMPVTAIRLTLGARVYLGQFQDGSAGRWQPLVDAAVFDTVQARLATHPTFSRASGAHLLTGFLRCPVCSSRMGGWHNGHGRYRCSSYNAAGVRTCKFTASARPVDADVLARIGAVLAPLVAGDQRVTRALAREWKREGQPDDSLTRERARLVARAEQDAADARRRLGDGARLLVDGELDRDGYQALAVAEQARLAAAEQILATAVVVPAPTAPLPALANVLASLNGWQAALLSAEIPEQREVLKLLVASVGPRRVRHGHYETDVAFTPLGTALASVA